jgi:hypothetical protein
MRRGANSTTKSRATRRRPLPPNNKQSALVARCMPALVVLNHYRDTVRIRQRGRDATVRLPKSAIELIQAAASGETVNSVRLEIALSQAERLLTEMIPSALLWTKRTCPEFVNLADHKLEGTYQAVRHASRNEPDGGPPLSPRPPAWLSADARVAWREVRGLPRSQSTSPGGYRTRRRLLGGHGSLSADAVSATRARCRQAPSLPTVRRSRQDTHDEVARARTRPARAAPATARQSARPKPTWAYLHLDAGSYCGSRRSTTSSKREFGELVVLRGGRK